MSPHDDVLSKNPTQSTVVESAVRRIASRRKEVIAMRMSYTTSWSSIRAILTVCVAVTLVLAPVHPVRAMPQPQQTSNPANKKKQDKIKAAPGR
jgi:hypothetical protein